MSAPHRSPVALLGVLALCALAVAAVLLLGRDPTPPPTGVPAPAGGGDPASAAAASPREASAGEAEAAADIVLRTALRAELEKVPAPRLAARLGDSELTGPVELVAGAGTADPRAAVGRHLVDVTLGDGRHALRVVDLDRESGAVVQLWADRLLAGVVVDADGEPLAGASVWAGVRSAAGRSLVAPSDADGRFELDGVPAGAGVPVVAEAAGHAAAFVVVDHDPQRAGDDLALTLRPGGTIEVVLASDLPDPAGCAIVLAPSTGAEGRAELRDFPLWLGALDRAERPALDPQGRGRVDGVPRAVAFDVVLEHPRLAGGAAIARDVVCRGATVRVVVPGSTATDLASGVVRAADGTPVGGARIVAEPEHGAPLRGRGLLLPAAAHARLRAETETAADGSFALARPSRGSVLRVTTPGGPTLRWPAAELPAELLAPRIDAAQAGAVRVRLRADAPLRVASPDGAVVLVADDDVLALRVDRPGVYAVVATAPGRSAARAEGLAASGGAVLELDLRAR
ncbi:MAG: carboxypeptidase regulatory-like domain-containing protein [Planctomycetes bacterium]|nr:carboxypeptidase regulatory-like domain-containing protein [Planctomycetota bacterium]